jgi:hypothetical protein
MSKGPAAWQYRVAAQSESRYKLERKAFTDVSKRPGVICYCVASDQQEFWVTMTSLNSDVASAAVIKRVANRPKMKYWMVHAAGSDYPMKKY